MDPRIFPPNGLISSRNVIDLKINHNPSPPMINRDLNQLPLFQGSSELRMIAVEKSRMETSPTFSFDISCSTTSFKEYRKTAERTKTERSKLSGTINHS
jgi:hypothetical protein